MSAALPADMGGPQVKTPLLLLLLLVLALTGTGLCQDESTDSSSGTGPTAPDASTTSTTVENTEYIYSSTGQVLETSNPEFDHGAETSESPITTLVSEGEGLDLIIILIPAVLVVAIIGIIVCGIFICRSRSKSAANEELGGNDPYLDGSSVEKVPMPMFEEDVPSVLELEMEELDQWMKKAGETTEEASQS